MWCKRKEQIRTPTSEAALVYNFPEIGFPEKLLDIHFPFGVCSVSLRAGYNICNHEPQEQCNRVPFFENKVNNPKPDQPCPLKCCYGVTPYRSAVCKTLLKSLPEKPPSYLVSLTGCEGHHLWCQKFSISNCLLLISHWYLPGFLELNLSKDDITSFPSITYHSSFTLYLNY